MATTQQEAAKIELLEHFKAWVKKYWEKKAAGEKNIQIEPERLE